MSFVTLVALGLAFGYAAFQRGGVDQSDWNVALLAIGLTGSVHFLWRFRQKVPRLDPLAIAFALAFLFLVGLQLVPLPVGLVRILSPKRVELLEASAPFTGAVPSSTTLSATPAATLNYLLTVAAYLLVFLLVRDICLRLERWPWAVVWPILIVTGLEAALGLYQSSLGGAAAIATGTYANRDHYAGLLEMALPLAAVYGFSVFQSDQEGFVSRVAPALKASLLFAIAGVMLVAIILSLSRMGFLASLTGLLVAGCGIAIVRGTRVDYTAEVPLWRRLAPAAAVVFVIVAGFLLLPTNALIARFATLANTDEVSVVVRSQIWRDTVGLIKDYPLFGCGMGGYESCFLRYKTVAPMFTIQYAHNDYLQVLAEMGVTGFAAGLLFIFRLLQKTVHGCIYAHSVDERDLAIACLASMIAMLLHSVVDFNMYVPANGLVFAWIAGMAGVNLRRTPRRQAERGKQSKGPKVARTVQSVPAE